MLSLKVSEEHQSHAEVNLGLEPYQAVALYTLGHVLSLQALSLPELIYEMALQGENSFGGLQDFGPPLSFLIMKCGHLHGQAIGLREQLVLSLHAHLFHYLPKSERMYFSQIVLPFVASADKCWSLLAFQ